MTLEEAIKARIEARVPELEGRVDFALEFVKVMDSKKPVSRGAQAFVLPAGTVGGKANAMVGEFSQSIRRGISIVTMLMATDQGARAMARLPAFLDDIKSAICGWSPAGTVGVFVLGNEQILRATDGVLAFLTEFHVNDELRTQP